MTVVDLHQAPQELARTVVEEHRDEAGWLDEFADALDRGRAGRQLERVLSVWGLSQAEAGRVLGVSRQAVGKWLAAGVPGDRLEVISVLAAATDILVHYLRRDRIPAVVRRPSTRLAGASLLDLVAADRPRDALDACRAMFDVAGAHA